MCCFLLPPLVKLGFLAKTEPKPHHNSNDSETMAKHRYPFAGTLFPSLPVIPLPCSQKRAPGKCCEKQFPLIRFTCPLRYWLLFVSIRCSRKPPILFPFLLRFRRHVSKIFHNSARKNIVQRWLVIAAIR